MCAHMLGVNSKWVKRKAVNLNNGSKAKNCFKCDILCVYLGKSYNNVSKAKAIFSNIEIFHFEIFLSYIDHFEKIIYIF